jgi:hypothetical protein
MYRKLIRTLAMALTVLCVVAALALAGSQKVTGTVTDVQPTKGSVTLMTKDGKTQALSGPQKLLAGLRSGDNVEAVIEGKEIKAINKK